MHARRNMTIGIALLFLVFTRAASADIVGDLKIGSSSGITLSLLSISFNADPGSNPPGNGTPIAPWNGEVANGTSLRFAGCPLGVLGTPGCLDSAPFTPSEAIEIANGVPITAVAGLGPNNPFLQFAGNGVTHATLLYTLTVLGPGASNTNCTGLSVGESCSVFAGSPIILTDGPTGTTATIAVSGTATDGISTSNWLGAFQLPIAGETPGQIQLFFCPSGVCTPADFAAGRTISSSQSGDLVASSTSPEPRMISIALIGGLLAMGLVRMRRSSPRPSSRTES